MQAKLIEAWQLCPLVDPWIDLSGCQVRGRYRNWVRAIGGQDFEKQAQQAFCMRWIPTVVEASQRLSEITCFSHCHCCPPTSKGQAFGSSGCSDSELVRHWASNG
jgi:hypothetical protein